MGDEVQQDTNESLIEFNHQNLSTKDFRAVFYQMTAKPDSMTKVFPKDIAIELSDIHLLNDRICEKLSSHYNNAGFLITVDVKFSNAKTKSFSTWEAFDSHKWFESESINKIVVTWEFNAMLPQYPVPQKHTLTVKMSNSMRPEEMLNIIFTGNIEDLEELDKNFFPVVARVDFIDRVLGDELLNIVSDWIKGLKNSWIEKSKTILYFKKNKGKISSFLNILSYIIIIISSVVLTGNYIRTLKITTIGEMTPTQLICIMNAIFICAGTWILAKKFISIITDRIYQLLSDYGDNCLFNITKGDRNRQDRISKKEKYNRISIIFNLITTILLNVICGIIANNLF